MAARGIALRWRIQLYSARSATLEMGLTNWWAYMRQEHLCSSVENVRQVEATGSAENPRASRQRWKILPPVPLESAVRALGEIESISLGHENDEDKVKRLTALRWVAKCCPNVPHSLIQKLFRLRQIRLRTPNEKSHSDDIESCEDTRMIKVSAKETLKEGALLYIPAAVSQILDKESSTRNNQQTTVQDIKWLRSLVLHKDEELIIINKPTGLAVQGGSDVVRSLNSMMEAALSYDLAEGPRLVHRLDKETSGALVVGRTQQSTIFLQALLRNKASQLSQASEGETEVMERRYLALVMGMPKAKEGRISAPLAKVVTDNGKLEKMRVVHQSHPNAQDAITHYKVLGPCVFGCSWLEIRPLTGRKHQIRVHCAEVLGMPIVGDYKYGWRAHRVWPPAGHEDIEKLLISRVETSGSLGHVLSKRPLLHLHCRQFILPDVAAVFQRQSRKQPTVPALNTANKCRTAESLDVIAPLPSHMDVSWKMRPHV